jgi:anaerobic selenocysteine-containing dehydrogenase
MIDHHRSEQRADCQSVAKPNSILRQWDGPLTRELLLSPGTFGLGLTPSEMVPTQTTTAVCGFCATGCGLRLHVRDGVAVGLTPETDYPVNLGMACPKGWEALRVLDAPNRAKYPMMRSAQGELVRVSWDEALRHFVTRMKAIKASHGPGSVAFLSTGQIVTEEMALLGSLFKFGMGFLHGDSNTRQCMATSHVAYKQCFGFDAPPYTYQDFETSDCLVFVGANPCIAHPIMWERVLRNKRRPEIIVVDPRRTETAMAATEYVAIEPKGDLALLYGIARELIQRDWIDRRFIDQSTSGFEAFAVGVDAYTPARVMEVAGVEPSQLERIVSKIHHAQAASFWWTMGVNQSYQGVRTAQAIIALALMTGNIGREGTGANSITGQCNAMGSRVFGNATSLIGGYDFGSAADRDHVAQILGIDAAQIPTQASLPYDQILEGVRRGEIRGLWVIATNPAHSWIDQEDARELLERLDFLVVQDMYGDTHTAKLADMVLPAAAWGEKEGTLINSERRIGLVKKLRPAPGEALSDFQIFRAIAHYWTCGKAFERWESPAAAFEILKQLSAGKPCDLTGITDYAMIDRCGGVQWPWSQHDARSHDARSHDALQNDALQNDADPPRERRLFSDGRFFTADGRARFLFDPSQRPPEVPCDEYPFWLLTGRGTVSQWHTQTRTQCSPVLRKLYPHEAYIEVHPNDAKELGVANGDRVRVWSRRGEAEAAVWITPQVQPGQLFMPMHYDEVNRLTLRHFDPHSRQPSYKDCAVAISRLDAVGSDLRRRPVRVERSQ